MVCASTARAGSQFAVLDDDVLAFAILVALHDLVFLYRGRGVGARVLDRAFKNLLMSNPLTCASADLIEASLPLGLSRHAQLDTERNKRDLNSTIFPATKSASMNVLALMRSLI
jgi:hypothetical protein